jgi:hypothetical protein
MFGPALAGLVSGRFGPVLAIGVDGISFAASIVILVLVRFRPAMEQPGGESDGPGFLNQWLTGLHFLLNNRPLRAITLIIMLYYAVTAGALNLFLFYLNLFLFYLKSNLNQSVGV